MKSRALLFTLAACHLLSSASVANAENVLTFDGSFCLRVDDGNTAASQVFKQNFSQMTIEYWVKPSNTPTTYTIHLERCPSSTSAIGKSYWWSGISQTAGLMLTSTFNAVGEPDTYDHGKTTVTLPKNKWTHVAATWVGGVNGYGAVYTNGVLVAEYAVSAPMTGNTETGAIAIGGTVTYSNTDRFFKGSMSDLRIWDRARSQMEIVANMNRRLTGGESGLVGYWKMDDGTGASAIDSTANANHAIAYSAKTTLASSVGWTDDSDLAFAADDNSATIANPITGSLMYTSTNVATVVSLPVPEDAEEYQVTLGTDPSALSESAWISLDPSAIPEEITFPAPATDGEFTVGIWTRGGGATNVAPGTLVWTTSTPNVYTKDVSIIVDPKKGRRIAASEIDFGSTDPCGIFSRTVVPEVVYGPTNVLLVVMNSAGVTASASAEVTVSSYLDLLVSPDGDDGTATGLADAPFRTVSAALAAAGAAAATSGEPAMVRVASGTYSAATGETLPLAVPANVSLVGSGIGETIIDGASQSPLLSISVSASTETPPVVSGLSLRNAATGFVAISGPWNGTLADCEMTGLADGEPNFGDKTSAIVYYRSTSAVNFTMDGIVATNITTGLRRLMTLLAPTGGTLSITNCHFVGISTSTASAENNGNFHVASPSGVDAEGWGADIYDCVFEDISAPGGDNALGGFFYFGHTKQASTGYIRFDRCIFRRFAFDGGEVLFAPHGVHYFYLNNSLVCDIEIGPGSNRVILGGYSSRPQPRGSTLHDCGGALFRPNPYPMGSAEQPAYAYNCSISSCETLATRSSYLSVHNCNIVDTPPGEGYDAFSSEAVTSYAPNYVSADRGDFRLKPTSQLIDAGYSLKDGGLGSLDGNVRPLDGDGDGNALFDIGAYEFVPGADARFESDAGTYGFFPGQSREIALWVESDGERGAVTADISYPDGVTGPSTVFFPTGFETNAIVVTVSDPLPAASGSLLEIVVSDERGALDDFYVGVKVSDRIVALGNYSGRAFVRTGVTRDLPVSLPSSDFVAPADIVITVEPLVSTGLGTISWTAEGTPSILSGSSAGEGVFRLSGGSEGLTSVRLTLDGGFVFESTGTASIDIELAGYGSVLWVSPDGSDATGMGTEDSPLRTLSFALPLLGAGESLRMKAGVYCPANGEVFPVTIAPGVDASGVRGPLGTPEDTSIVDPDGTAPAFILGTVGTVDPGNISGGALRHVVVRNALATAVRTRFWGGEIEDCLITQVVDGGNPTDETAALRMDTIRRTGGTVLNGVEISCVTSSVPRIFYLTSGTASLSITNCWFHDLASTAPLNDRGLFDTTKSVTICDTRFERISATSAIGGTEQGIVYFHGGVTATFNRCVFDDIVIDAASNNAFYRASVIAINGDKGATHVCNTLFHNVRGQKGSPCFGGYNCTPYIRNCTFDAVDSVIGHFFNNIVNTSYIYNSSISDAGRVYCATPTDNAPLELHNVNIFNPEISAMYSTNLSSNVTFADPLYRDAANGDFRPRSSSPLVDAGDNEAAVEAGDFDLLFADRVMDGNRDGVKTVDIGAFEFDPAGLGTVLLLR